MNTPSHAILNLALLSSQPQAVVPVIAGGILPDVPMFVMYFWAKRVRRLPERQIWAETYWHPFWQAANHSFHSIPLQAIAIGLCHGLHWSFGELLFLSALLHSFADLPLHNHDAHRHFFPFSHYRFISPISYWDPRCFGREVGRVEKLLVLAASVYLFAAIDSWLIRVLLVIVNATYLTGYFYRWVFQGCVRQVSNEAS